MVFQLMSFLFLLYLHFKSGPGEVAEKLVNQTKPALSAVLVLIVLISMITQPTPVTETKEVNQAGFVGVNIIPATLEPVTEMRAITTMILSEVK